MSGWRSRWLVGLVAIGAVSIVVGCGPGIGGTGTGSAALVAFQASPSPVCDSTFADRLDCPGAPTGPAAAAGTAAVRFADASSNLVLEIDGNDARLAAGCQRLHFVGTFAIRAGAVAPAFVGSYRPDGSSDEVLAVLTVQRVDPAGLTIELRDIDGRLIVPTATLLPIGGALPAPGSC